MSVTQLINVLFPALSNPLGQSQLLFDLVIMVDRANMLCLPI